MTVSSSQGTRLAKQLSGLRLAALAATIMILVQAGLGFWIAASIEVPDKDKGGDVFTSVGRVLSKGPIGISLHAGLGLILIITAISVTIRALLAGRVGVLLISLIGLAAILAANFTGARFVSNGDDTNSTAMELASLVAIVCYVICLGLARGKRAGTR